MEGKRNIALYCNDGSPLGVTPDSVYEDGVGGAELSLLSWSETMAARGHTVTVYNNPEQSVNMYDGRLQFKRQDQFRPSESVDVFIAFRSPNPHLTAAQARIKIHWSMDQYTIGRFDRDVFPFVDRVVCISPFHAQYHKATYNVDPRKVTHIDLGVRLDDYTQPVNKIPGRCIFCSISDRGLEILHDVWGYVLQHVPHASLVITSDYRLWFRTKNDTYQGLHRAGNTRHRLQWLESRFPDISFLGKVDRAVLTREQQKAVCQPYPCTYDELFCVSTAECQVAGAYPITATTGALATTNEFGQLIGGNPRAGAFRKAFASALVDHLTSFDQDRLDTMSRLAKRRFDWNQIAGEWENLFDKVEAGKGKTA